MYTDRRDAMFFVVRHLLGAAAVRFVDGKLHRIGDTVGVHNDMSLRVTGRAPNGLDQRSARAQETFLIRIQDGNQRDFRQVEPFAQQVDAHDHVEDTQAQVSQDTNSL